MDTKKLRPSELMAAVGGLVLLIALLFLEWYSVDVGPIGGGFGAGDGAGFLGWIANLIVFAAAVVAIGLAVVKLTSTSVSLPVAASALTAAGGVAAVVLVVLRMLFRPGPEIEITGVDVGLKFGIFVALAGAVLQAVGGWKAMKEEGTTFDQAREQLSDRIGGDSGSQPSGGSPAPDQPPTGSGEPSVEQPGATGPPPDQPAGSDD